MFVVDLYTFWEPGWLLFKILVINMQLETNVSASTPDTEKHTDHCMESNFESQNSRSKC